MSNQWDAVTDADACCAPGALLREPLSAADAADMAVKLKALADPRSAATVLDDRQPRRRRGLRLRYLRRGVEVSQPTVSHHLKVLRDAGLLTSQRRASWVYYAVVPQALASLAVLLGADTRTEVPA